MNASANFLLVASICVLGGGCATDGIPVRITEIRAVQTGGEDARHAGLSASAATNLFYDVASRLDSLGRVNPPHQCHPDSTKPTSVEYEVSFTPEGASTVGLTMEIDGKHVIFRGDTDVDPKSLAALQKAMTLCRESLDKRQIKYRVRTFTTQEFLDHK